MAGIAIKPIKNVTTANILLRFPLDYIIIKYMYININAIDAIVDNT